MITDTITIMPDNGQKHIMARIKQSKKNAYFRKGSYSTEIIWGDRRFFFPAKKQNGSAYSDMWIFRSVMQDAKRYIGDKQISPIERHPVNFWSKTVVKNKAKITATDVNHAYWRIAYMNGYISGRTYEKGLLIQEKTIRLAALANLASAKQYFIIENGEVTKKSVTLRFDATLQCLYNNIRYECYGHMMNIAKLLGNQFICYKTDCIYYLDNKKNRELVQSYMDSVGFDWKQLIEIEM